MDRSPPRKLEGISRAEAARLAGHVLVPSGDPALTRALLARGAVRVVQPRRNRLEQVAVAATPDALAAARVEVEASAGRRAASRDRSRERRARDEAEYRADFEDALRARYPSMPDADRAAVVAQACEVSSGRVGRTAAAKALGDEPLRLAVRARIRHAHTDYDERLVRAGLGRPFGRCSREARGAARRAIGPTVDAVERAWARPRGAAVLAPGDVACEVGPRDDDDARDDDDPAPPSPAPSPGAAGEAVGGGPVEHALRRSHAPAPCACDDDDPVPRPLAPSPGSAGEGGGGGPIEDALRRSPAPAPWPRGADPRPRAAAARTARAGGGRAVEGATAPPLWARGLRPGKDRSPPRA